MGLSIDASVDRAEGVRLHLRDGRELRAHLGERDPGADLRDRPGLDGFDQAFEHVVEQRDLLVVVAIGRRQEKIRHAPDGLEALFLGSEADGRFDFFGNREACIWHRSS